nr:ATP-binding protein [Pseudomonas sp. dw_358]
MDEFDIQTGTEGTRIRALKVVFPPQPFPSEKRIQEIRRQLQHEGASDPYVELQVRGSELLLTSSELHNKQQELEATNQELENTNKGVVALYSELEKASQELQEASDSKSRFFSNMTHEFRTPINIIENISKLLLKGADGELNPEQYKQVRFISSAAGELSDLVNELLDLAEAESGRMDIVPTRFSLADFTEQLRQFTGALSMRYPSIAWQIAPVHSDVMLDTDRNRLFQILRNLITNAFKYTPEGSVTVRCLLPDNETVEFLVEDSGVGISEDNQARIFEEFARVRIPGLAHVQGNGLGLPLAARLAALLRGEIQLHSEPGAGSRFTARIAREHHQSAVDLQNLDLSGITVLVIDDNEADRYLVHHVLEPFHAVVMESPTAAASIDKMHAIRPDIILLDLDLPDIYGADLLESMDWSLHSRVLINTAKPLENAERDRLLGMCQGILLKTQPDYAEALLQHVQRLAGSLSA